jgi:hypothetical protein
MLVTSCGVIVLAHGLMQITVENLRDGSYPPADLIVIRVTVQYFISAEHISFYTNNPCLLPHVYIPPLLLLNKLYHSVM